MELSSKKINGTNGGSRASSGASSPIGRSSSRRNSSSSSSNGGGGLVTKVKTGGSSAVDSIRDKIYGLLSSSLFSAAIIICLSVVLVIWLDHFSASAFLIT